METAFEKTAFELSTFFGVSTEAVKTSVLLEICQRDPAFLLDCIRTATQPLWKKKAIELLPEEKLSAIKICRALTGMSLKDAKDAVDALQEELGL